MTDTEGRYVDDPAQDARVAALLAAAAAPVEPGPLPGEDVALAAFGAVHRDSGRHHMRSSLVSFKAGLAAAVGAGVLLTGGAAAAATGSLPDAAQSTAQSVLGNLGISVPGPNSQHANEHATPPHGASGSHVPTTTTDETGSPSQATSDQEQADDQSTDPTDGQTKGSKISQLATSTTSTGVDKGKLISSTASGDKSQAGQHGKAVAPEAGDHSQTGADHSQAGADHSQTGADHSQPGTQHQPQPGSQGSDASAAGRSTAADTSAGHSAAGATPGSQRP